MHSRMEEEGTKAVGTNPGKYPFSTHHCMQQVEAWAVVGKAEPIWFHDRQQLRLDGERVRERVLYHYNLLDLSTVPCYSLACV